MGRRRRMDPVEHFTQLGVVLPVDPDDERPGGGGSGSGVPGPARSRSRPRPRPPLVHERERPSSFSSSTFSSSRPVLLLPPGILDPDPLPRLPSLPPPLPPGRRRRRRRRCRRRRRREPRLQGRNLPGGLLGPGREVEVDGLGPLLGRGGGGGALAVELVGHLLHQAAPRPPPPSPVHLVRPPRQGREDGIRRNSPRRRPRRRPSPTPRRLLRPQPLRRPQHHRPGLGAAVHYPPLEGRHAKSWTAPEQARRQLPQAPMAEQLGADAGEVRGSERGWRRGRRRRVERRR